MYNTQKERKRNENESVAAVLLGMLLMLEMTALLGKSDKVGESHAAKTDVIERVDGVGLNVLGVVVIQAPLERILEVTDGQHRLQVCRHLLHFHALYLVVEVPHRHLRGDLLKP